MPINCKMYLVSACVERACLSNLIAVLCWLNSAKPTPRPLTLSVPFRSHQLSCWRPLLNESGRLRGLLLKEPLVSKPSVISELSIKNKQERSLKNGAQWRSTRSSITGWTLDEIPWLWKRLLVGQPNHRELSILWWSCIDWTSAGEVLLRFAAHLTPPSHCCQLTLELMVAT